MVNEEFGAAVVQPANNPEPKNARHSNTGYRRADLGGRLWRSRRLFVRKKQRPCGSE